MPPALNPTPDWLKAENASVFDSTLTKLARFAGHLIGADSPQSQALGLMAPMQTGEAGGLMKQMADRFRTKIRAYHGSPHDFDAFSTAKIGTGEGNQAFGHGLYFAENEGVANTYKGVQGSASSDPAANVASKVIASGRDPAQRLRSIFPQMSDEQINAAIAKAKAPPAGHMYEVDINAHPDQFLDWDKPMSQQSGHVQNALGIAGQKPTEAEVNAMFALAKKRGVDPATMPEYKALEARMDSRIGAPGNPDVTGAEYYRGAPQLFEGVPQPAMSANLQSKGIAGIKFLDQGSRATGKGTQNYVVFDEKLIDIARKYGIAGAAATGLTADQALKAQMIQRREQVR